MSNVFFISDLHNGHGRLCSKYRGLSVKENLEALISAWNNVVEDEDKVYVLGDVTMANKKWVRPFFSRVKGEVVVIGGNHDNIGTCKELNSMGIPVLGAMKYRGFFITHMPCHLMEIDGFCKGNIHGHVHDPSVDYGRLYYNVCVDRIGFTPKPFKEIEQEFIKRKRQ